MDWVTNERKRCTKCKEVKSISLFHKNPKHSSGYKSQCAECSSIKFKEWRNKDIEKNRIRERVSHYVSTYKITKEEALELVLDRVGVCPICQVRCPLVVDHCHTTGKVRGLICHSCNSMLGYSKDSQKTLEKAILYLRSHYG
jgi:hypothetical protein